MLIPNVAIAQTLPTSQPNMITIVREEVKLGRDADHAKVEAGWPAVYEKAKSPDYYLAMTSMTGAPGGGARYRVCVARRQIGDSLKREDGERRGRLMGRAHAPAHASRRRTPSTAFASFRRCARKDLSYGAYP